MQPPSLLGSLIRFIIAFFQGSMFLEYVLRLIRVNIKKEQNKLDFAIQTLQLLNYYLLKLLYCEKALFGMIDV